MAEYINKFGIGTFVTIKANDLVNKADLEEDRAEAYFCNRRHFN